MMNDPTIEQLQARLKESEATNQLLHEAMVIAEKRGVDKGKEEAELRIKELEAACAHMREALQSCHMSAPVREWIFDQSKVFKALSTSAGKELLERLERLESAIEMIADFLRKMESECRGHTEAGRLFSVEAPKVATQALKTKGA